MAWRRPNLRADSTSDRCGVRCGSQPSVRRTEYRPTVEISVEPLGIGVGTLAPLGWLSLPVFWGSQVFLMIVGHVIAVVAAHHVAVERYSSLSAARRGHLPLVVLMMGYTVLSLWITSQPVVGARYLSET